MKFFHPQVQLARQSVLDEPDQFVLHAVTFCPYTNCRANGHDIQAKDGAFEVSLFILEDPDLPRYDFITPVVHTIRLGSFPSGKNNGDCHASVVVQSEMLSRGGLSADEKPKAKTTVSTTTATEDGKPV